MKKNFPMLGAVHIVGKDSKGQKVILPTLDRRNKKSNNSEKRNKPSWLKRVVASFRQVEKQGEVRVRIDHNWSLQICRGFQEGVHHRILAAQKIWRDNRRKASGLTHAKNTY